MDQTTFLNLYDQHVRRGLADVRTEREVEAHVIRHVPIAEYDC